MIKEASKKFMIHKTSLEPIVYTTVEESGVQLTIRFLCEPRQRREIEQDIWQEVLDVFEKEADMGVCLSYSKKIIIQANLNNEILRYTTKDTLTKKSSFGVASEIIPLLVLMIFLRMIFLKISITDIILEPSINTKIRDVFNSKQIKNTKTYKIAEVELLCPLDKISSLRDAYAFRQHVKTSRENRGLKMIDEFDSFPVYYYSNHNAVSGPGLIEINNAFIDKLDYELKIVIIIGKKGRDIS